MIFMVVHEEWNEEKTARYLCSVVEDHRPYLMLNVVAEDIKLLDVLADAAVESDAIPH
jgi:hypothetical protein